jgi:sensor domain CHASE-containing protein
MWKIGGLVMFVFAMVLTFASMAAAEPDPNFRICINGTNNNGDSVDYVLFAEPNDARDFLYDVNGTGSISISGVTDLDLLVSGTSETKGLIIDLFLEGKTIVENNQYSSWFSLIIDAQADFPGRFVTGITVTDLTNSNPETRYKIQGTAQIIQCE